MNNISDGNKIPRETWGKQIEFLLSCIAMSVGLGNIWRFPFTALENGGGAFVIPYLIVLFLVGKPIYFMEMAIGQFSSSGGVKVYDFCPIFRGVGFAQTVSLAISSSYYSALIAIIFKYFFDSFNFELPWSNCKESWTDVTCVPSKPITNHSHWTVSGNNQTKTSAELYFKDVLRETSHGIENGIGFPNPELVMFLALSWTLVFFIMIKGIKTSGKVSYLFVILPYATLGILLMRSLTLPGSWNGIVFFLKPRWGEMLKAKVWYSAVTQVFFSLSVCFSNIIMYSSYNKFDHNIYRDVTIITSLDTLTSMMAGCSIFGTLGNLAFEVGTEDISSVISEDTRLAFISYPDALAKFQLFPQLFSALFFFMLLTLGIGTNIAQTACFMTVIRDRFPKIPHWKVVLGIAITGICLGSIYLTPGGQQVLKLVDFFGCSFVVLILAIAELITISWIYGVDRLCKDIEFMLGVRPNFYWRACWSYVTPSILIFIFFYNIWNFEGIRFEGQKYPDFIYAIGWCISAFGLLQIPIFGFFAITKQKEKGFWGKFKAAAQPSDNWGPNNLSKNLEYRDFIVKEFSI